MKEVKLGELAVDNVKRDVIWAVSERMGSVMEEEEEVKGKEEEEPWEIPGIPKVVSILPRRAACVPKIIVTPPSPCALDIPKIIVIPPSPRRLRFAGAGEVTEGRLQPC